MESSTRFDIRFEKVALCGTTASVTYAEHNAAIMCDATGQRYTREASGRESALWVESDAGWLAACAERLGSRTLDTQQLPAS